MKSEEREFVLRRLDQAQEALEDARILLERNRLQGSINRLYYACFYAVTALLFTEGNAAAKHKGVLMLFDRHWIGTGRLPREAGRFFHRLFDRRHRGDYGKSMAFSRNEVEAWSQEATDFVARISAEIDKQLETGRQGNSC